MSKGLSENGRAYLFQAYERFGSERFDKEDIDLGIRRNAGSLVMGGYLKRHKEGKTYSLTSKGLHYYRLMRHRGQE
ncbi:MAG TPA: hypothetical protein PK955_00805 [Methanoregulaceae archaeon]|nr:hypothetical protein [Methanoregulaceae archaeon]